MRSLAVLGLAVVFGLTFSAFIPLGVRFGNPVDVPESAVDQPLGSGPTATGTPSAAVAMPPLPFEPDRRRPTARHTPAPDVAAGLLDSDALPYARAAEAAMPSTFVPPSSTSWTAIRPLAEQGKVLLVDARAKPLYEAGHIPGALCLPEDSTHETLTAFAQQYGTNTPVVVYCSNPGCSLSFKLAYKLARDYAFANVQFVTGGYLEWQRATGSLGTNAPAGKLLATNLPAAVPAPNAEP